MCIAFEREKDTREKSLRDIKILIDGLSDVITIQELLIAIVST